ncbi:MAG: sulfurtransferase TusA family protein [Syntrophomonadaceae bacterium]|jgi:tRNA 2-thiouridine synthesizing protein A|nr:sulfurtransferase TusA family protein [Syntrophomonadaceae bacterium]NLX01760.1 SirA family protein [Syntrophomonadaceae bacterium]
MNKLDVRGLSCPVPVLRTKKAIDDGATELLIMGSSQVSKENVSKLAASQGFKVNIKVDHKDLWEMEIKK